MIVSMVVMDMVTVMMVMLETVMVKMTMNSQGPPSQEAPPPGHSRGQVSRQSPFSSGSGRCPRSLGAFQPRGHNHYQQLITTNIISITNITTHHQRHLQGQTAKPKTPDWPTISLRLTIWEDLANVCDLLAHLDYYYSGEEDYDDEEEEEKEDVARSILGSPDHKA